ncbi:MAG: hypothetical protein WCH09_02525 [Bacteroidota bacterium]|jgi:hypothetical protein
MGIRKYIVIAFIGALNVLSAQYEGISSAPSDTTKPITAVRSTPASVPTVRVITTSPSKNVYESFNNVSMSRPVAKQTYLGFNTSFLLGQILPFNAIPLQQNMYALTYRSYKRNSGYRLNVGFDVDGGDGFHWFGGRIDYDTRRRLNGKWNYFYGGGVGLEIFDDPTAQPNFFSTTEVNLLGQLHWGFEYRVGELVSLSMETQAMLLIGSNSALRLRPPTVITAHFRL